MRRITALIHTHNDERRLGRCLEMLYPCDDVVVVDHGSQDRTVNIAREYGTNLLHGQSGPNRDTTSASTDEWLLCLTTRESLTEGLAATLYEWKLGLLASKADGFSLAIREESNEGWTWSTTSEPRFVPCDWRDWDGPFPKQRPSATLEGELLRFRVP